MHHPPKRPTPAQSAAAIALFGAPVEAGTTPPVSPASRGVPVRVFQAGQSEARFQAQVVRLARLNGFLVYHTRDARGSNPGFPDLTLVRANPPRLVFLELKTATGRVRPEQQQWIDTLAAVPGIDARIVRPSDWDLVVRLLVRDEARPPPR